MKITLLDWNGEKHYVEIPDDTTEINGEIISGDMVMYEPKYYDTGKKNRFIDFYDGSFTIKKENFHKLDELSDSYEIFGISK